ncbi:MAG: aminotransferase class I/II-fold pyridoxal phosphate-dependent enzyme [Treponema sp.]|nr:aminotransferase class I/II-fold pyridoxal phosphate-dependent enzyme [Treponema sp.]
MQALMLAAGMGKRLGKYTENATKCMVPVNGKALIDYAIEALIEAGIKKFTLVVGYKRDVLKDYLKGKYPEITIEYIDNNVFDTTNNIYSLYMAKDVLAQDDTILLESDLIYDKKIIQELIDNPEKNLCVVSPFESWMDGTVTVLDESKGIQGILGKADFNWDNKSNYYKTVNIYKFSKEFAKDFYMPFLKAYQSAYGKNEYYETVLKVISFLDKSTLKAHVVDGSRWYEIDDPADLAIASTRFSTGFEHYKNMTKTYGGYWRYPSMLDYCYLVNPYFPPKTLVNEMKSNFATLMESYPSGDKQQSLLAGKIFKVKPEHIAVGNGAAELIASISELKNSKIVVPYPTFNEYPERFGDNNVIWMHVNKDDFSYTTDEVIKTVKDNNADTVLLINPENPSGHYFVKEDVLSLAAQLKAMDKTLILDESFADFAKADIRFTFITEDLLNEYPNVIVIKSISKSYGVPGFRLGVLASSDDALITKVQKNTSIWNINSYGEFFLQIFDKYKKLYSAGCDKIVAERERFVEELSKIDGITVYPSQANYVLCKLIGKISSQDLAVRLLDNHNILIKDLSGKKGFEQGNYIRLAVRSSKDNDFLLDALKGYLK